MKPIFYSLIYILTLISSSAFSKSQISEIGSNSDVKVIVYPIPTTGPLNITYSAGQVINPRVFVYDMLGNLVNTIEAERQTNNTFILDIGEKEPGYYFIKIQGDNGTVSRRITVKN